MPNLNGGLWKYPSLNLLSKPDTVSGRGGGTKVKLSDLVAATKKMSSEPNLNVGVGYDNQGGIQTIDLSIESNLLVVGVPGCGKSNLIHTILLSLLFQNAPSDLKLIIIDSSGVELKSYNDTPHLLTPVINNVEKTISALKWAVAEAERRIKVVGEARKRNIREYNESREDEGMPDIVIIIDELAQVIPYAPGDIEALTIRLAQRSRIVGIHLLITSSDVSTDILIKELRHPITNTIAFRLASKSDSNLILGSGGAEVLTKRGDMLLQTRIIPNPKLVHSVFISTEQINIVTNYLGGLGPPNYNDEVPSQPTNLNSRNGIFN